MMLARLGLLALFLAISTPAVASDWWWVGTSEEAPHRINLYVDNESAESDRDSRRVRAWIYTHRETATDSGEQATQMQIGVDCDKASWTLFSSTSYASNGKDLGTSNYPDTGEEMTPFEAGSIGETLLRVACGAERPLEQGIQDPLRHSLSILEGPVEHADGGGAARDGGELSSGTGFFVGPAGQLLTSYHVVENARRIACRMPDGAVANATLLRASPANDIAVLQADTRPDHYLGLAAPNSLHHGDRVFTIGFPAIGFLGVEPRFTDGTVSALSIAGEDAFVQISVPIQPGNSGGPLVTEAGEVVGIIAATTAIEPFYQGTGTLPQNLNWAVKAEYARPMLSAPSRPAARTREEAIERVRRSVCLVVVER